MTATAPTKPWFYSWSDESNYTGGLTHDTDVGNAKFYPFSTVVQSSGLSNLDFCAANNIMIINVMDITYPPWLVKTDTRLAAAAAHLDPDTGDPAPVSVMISIGQNLGMSGYFWNDVTQANGGLCNWYIANVAQCAGMYDSNVHPYINNAYSTYVLGSQAAQFADYDNFVPTYSSPLWPAGYEAWQTQCTTLGQVMTRLDADPRIYGFSEVAGKHMGGWVKSHTSKPCISAWIGEAGVVTRTIVASWVNEWLPDGTGTYQEKYPDTTLALIDGIKFEYDTVCAIQDAETIYDSFNAIKNTLGWGCTFCPNNANIPQYNWLGETRYGPQLSEAERKQRAAGYIYSIAEHIGGLDWLGQECGASGMEFQDELSFIPVLDSVIPTIGEHFTVPVPTLLSNGVNNLSLTSMSAVALKTVVLGANGYPVDISTTVFDFVATDINSQTTICSSSTSTYTIFRTDPRNGEVVVLLTIPMVASIFAASGTTYTLKATWPDTTITTVLSGSIAATSKVSTSKQLIFQ